MQLRVWRKAKGLTQQAVADALATSKSFVCEIELGKRRPSPELALGIQDLTNGEVTAASLLGLDDAPRRKARNVREDGVSFDSTDRPWRQPVTVSVEVTLTAGELEDLEKYLPDYATVAAKGARAAIREAHQKAWTEANREAIEANRKWIEEHGTFAEQLGLI